MLPVLPNSHTDRTTLFFFPGRRGGGGWLSLLCQYYYCVTMFVVIAILFSDDTVNVMIIILLNSLAIKHSSCCSFHILELPFFPSNEAFHVVPDQRLSCVISGILFGLKQNDKRVRCQDFFQL